LEGEITYIEFHDIAIWFFLGHRQFSEHRAQTAYRYTTFQASKNRVLTGCQIPNFCGKVKRSFFRPLA
jgi:hypothetical protein